MRWVTRIAKWAGVCLLGLVLAGAFYQQIGSILDKGLALPPREMIAIDGHAMHLLQRVGQDNLSAGCGSRCGRSRMVAPAATSRQVGTGVCVRSFGAWWSDASAANATLLISADELAELVRAAKIPIPDHVGHSLGANIAIVYQKKYARDVSALVLIEPGDPKDLRGLSRDTPERCAGDLIAGRAAGLAAAGYVGIPRLAAQFLITDGKNLSGPALQQYRASLGRPAQNMALVASYVYALPKTAYEDLDVHSFGDTPVLIFASSDRFSGDGFDSNAEYEKWRTSQHAYLASLAAMSTHGSGPIIVRNSTHTSMVMGAAQSEFVAGNIASFAAAL